MIPTAKVPVTIVTGFLGAGKTTLIRSLITGVSDRRLAIIVNEFGDVGVDGTLLKHCSAAACPADRVIELANGCICCTVADDFVPALEALLALPEPPEHILVETSGLALPKPLLKAFDWPPVRARLTVDGVIAVVDGRAVADGVFASDPEKLAAERARQTGEDHDEPIEEVFEDQVQAADLVILNKTDLLSPAELLSVGAEIARVLPRAVRIVPSSAGRVDPAVLIGLSAAAEDDLAARPSHHDDESDHEHDEFEHVVVSVAPVASPGTIAARVNGAAGAHGLLRVKGFVAVDGKPMRLLVQAVGQRIETRYDRPWQPGEARIGQLVVIAEAGLDRAAVTAALAG